jgi:two-component system chemotaxis response regulator CheB
MRRAGGHTLVQDEASAVVYGMPGAALALDAADQVVQMDLMPSYLSGMVNR